jgi:hypothetical protein
MPLTMWVGKEAVEIYLMIYYPWIIRNDSERSQCKTLGIVWWQPWDVLEKAKLEIVEKSVRTRTLGGFRGHE